MIDFEYILIVGFKDGLIWFPIILGIGILISHLRILDISVDGIVIASGITCGFIWNHTNSYLYSFMGSIGVGVFLAIIVCFLIFQLQIHPIMAGIIFSFAIHSLSVVLVGESILLPKTNLITGILTIPIWLIFVVLLIATVVEYFFSHGLGIEIRAFGGNSQINTRRSPLFLALITYTLVGALYGLGAAVYTHSEGLARSGGSFEFLIIGLCAFLSIDRIIWLLQSIAGKGRDLADSRLSVVSKLRSLSWKSFGLVSTKAFLGAVFFQTIVFYVIFRATNPVYWKIVLSLILLISLINYQHLIDLRKRITRKQQKQELKIQQPFAIKRLFLEDISMTYTLGVEKRKVFEGANAEFKVGINIIRGPNGSGKSTLLKIIKGVIYPQKGRALYNNSNLFNIRLHGRPVFFISQNPFNICSPDLTLVENLATSIPGYSTITSNCSQPQIMKALSMVLDPIGIEPIEGYNSSFWQKEARSLSGGEAQCLCLYMSLLSKKPTILLDEPTTGLDAVNFERLVLILEAVRDEKLVIITTHDRRLDSLRSQQFNIESYRLKPELIGEESP